MALTEQRILKQVEILPALSAANVCWANQILRDGVVISEQLERKAYTVEQAEAFSVEVENSSSYIAALGWV